MLARVEKKLAGEPVVFVGVHSPKFPNERDEVMVREAVRRYGVTHPVVVDSGHAIWQQYAVRGWPTLVIVDPLGYVLGQASGEPDAAGLEGLIVQVLAQSRQRGIKLSTAPLPLRPEPAPAGELAHPGKVIARGGRVWIADTGHHRILEVSAEGRVLRRFGEGTPGLVDGTKPLFHHPNGLALDGDVLWVADTGNHAIRRIDMADGSATTVAGTGEMGRGLPRTKDWTGLPLRSPWDLAWDAKRQKLYVAMAGTHQLCVLDPVDGSLRVLAGTGVEARIDGPAEEAAFAQPSGLALNNDKLYVADSEISCVRELDLASGRVRTVAGGDLFQFGDVDGVGDEVRLQHPIGICAADGALLLADSFNHKVKRVDPASDRVDTLYGNGEPLRATFEEEARKPTFPAVAGPDAPLLFEPEGLFVDGEELYVADTNNHRVLAIHLPSGRVRRLLGGD